jgi:hypothetical protein
VYRVPFVCADAGRGKSSMRLTFSHDAIDGEDVVYDVEAMQVEYELAEPR